jgi:hypothetical protein
VSGTTRRNPLLSSIVGLVLLPGICFTSGCGAIGNANQSTSSISSLSISPAAATIRAGDTQSFVASGTAASSLKRPAVPRQTRWLVNGILGGNSTVGTINSQGLYAAPAAIPNPNQVEVTALNPALGLLPATARITLENPIPQVVSVSPNAVSLGDFTIKVTGKKFVRGAQVTFAGRTLPTTFNSSFQLTASGTATQADAGQAQISVVNSNPGSASAPTTVAMEVRTPSIQASSVTITPGAGAVRSGDSLQFSAVVKGLSNQAVSWSIGGIPGGNQAQGTIDAKGLYRSPAVVPVSGSVKVTATSTAIHSIAATVGLAVYNPIPVVTSVSPAALAVGNFKLIITGKKFTSGAQVIFGGSALKTTLNSSTQLTATGSVTAAQAGKVQVFVQNPNPGSASSAVANVQVASPAESSASAADADIRVDASKTLNETGKDDIAAAKNIYASASAPEADGGLSPDWNLISSQFAMKRMRNINGLGDCEVDSGGNLSGCTRLNGDLASMKTRGLTPHVIVGQWAPSSIGGDPRRWSASQWAQYDELCYAIVDYVANRFGGTGFQQSLFEVANEIDNTMTPDDLWLTPSTNVPQGDPSRFAQYDTVYRHWAKAVSKVAEQSPTKSVRIAAEAEGFERVSYETTWHNASIQTYAAQGVRLDMVALHTYGGDSGDIAKYAQSIRSALRANGLNNAEIWVTEWGASSTGDSYFGAINGTAPGAAWGIHFLLQALRGTITGGSFAEVRDNHGHDTAGTDSNLYGATWTHVEQNAEYPKAIANAFSMVDRMKGSRKSVSVSSAKPDLYALSSSDAQSASLIVANYNYMFDWNGKRYSDQSHNESVTVAFDHLPFTGPVTVDRYLIDANTSNLESWVAAGKTPPSVKATQVQRVESFAATATGGTLVLPAKQLGQSAVSMWIIHQ